jgi:cytochrome b involved in lipid metabolism
MSIVAKIFLVAFALVGLTACTPANEELENASESSMPSQESSSEIIEISSDQETDTATTYTLADIAEHATPEDCWTTIDGLVYDLSPYIAQARHPGGAAILESCGVDGTTFFFERPMGSGTAHSSQAQAGLAQYQIGVLANAETMDASASEAE